MPSSDSRDNASTLLRKLDPESLDALERAIVERTPPTFTDCFEQFKLAEKGLSFSAFYRYARRLRNTARIARFADLTVDDPQGAEKSLHHFIGQQLIDALMAQDPSSRVIHRLAQAYRMTAQVPLAKQRLELLQVNQQTTRAQLVARRAALIAEVTEYQEKIRREIDAVTATAPDPKTESTAASDKSPESPQVRSRENPIALESPWQAIADPKKTMLDRIDRNIDAALESRRMKGDSAFSP